MTRFLQRWMELSYFGGFVSVFLAGLVWVLPAGAVSWLGIVPSVTARVGVQMLLIGFVSSTLEEVLIDRRQPASTASMVIYVLAVIISCFLWIWL